MLTPEAQAKCKAAGVDPASVIAIVEQIITLATTYGPAIVAAIQKLINIFHPSPPVPSPAP